MRKVNLAEALATFSEAWAPRVAGEVNGFQVKLIKAARRLRPGVTHEIEDELFLVVEGRLRMGLRDGDIDLEAGEFLIVPHGVEHYPRALTDECHVLLLEPATTLNTDYVVSERAVRASRTPRLMIVFGPAPKARRQAHRPPRVK